MELSEVVALRFSDKNYMTTKAILNYLKVLGCLPKKSFHNLLPNLIKILCTCDRTMQSKLRRKFRSCIEIYIHNCDFETVSNLLGAEYQSLCTYIAREERRKQRTKEKNQTIVNKQKKKVNFI